MRSPSELGDYEYGLYFDTERNLRYYQRRTGLYRRLHLFNATLNVLFAGAAIIALAQQDATFNGVMQCVAMVAAVLNVLDIVLKFADKAAENDRINQQWGDLNARAKSLQPADRAGWDELCRQIDQQNLSEPKPFYRALDVICQAEVMAALRNEVDENYALLNCWERCTANFLVHGNLAIVLQQRRLKPASKCRLKA